MDIKKIENLYAQLIVELGYNLTDSSLQDTPKRVARFWDEFINYNPGKINTTFNSVTNDQMVVISGIRVWSLCEHHLMPFWCDIAIGYITYDKVLGLSKFARIAHKHAHKLQIQERLISDIANEIKAILGTDNVAVLASGVHTCMVARGIKTDGIMVSSYMGGAFKQEAARNEFLQLMK